MTRDGLYTQVGVMAMPTDFRLKALRPPSHPRKRPLPLTRGLSAALAIATVVPLTVSSRVAGTGLSDYGTYVPVAARAGTLG